MTTATELAAEQYERERLGRAIEAFVLRYQPEDRREAAQFTMQLHLLVSEIHRDATAPFVKMIGTLPLVFPTAGVRG